MIAGKKVQEEQWWDIDTPDDSIRFDQYLHFSSCQTYIYLVEAML
jgi:choline kinase